MKPRLPACAVLMLLLLPVVPGPAQEAKLPVFFLRYEAGIGVAEEEDEMQTSSHRNKVTLRVKEEWSKSVTTNLYSVVSRKEYLSDPGSYLYFYLNPDVAWRVNERVTWRAGLRSKWVWYDELDSGGLSKDLTSLLAKTELVMKLRDDLKLTPSLQSVFDLHRNEAKTQQLYTAGLSLESRLGTAWQVSGRFRGILDLPLGPISTADDRVNYEFALNASWDPNR